MSHVFISYSRKDTEAVDQIVARLEAAQFTVWIDREDIHGGDLWREAIVEAVDNAYAFVFMLSPFSVASDNVRKEVDLADGAGKTLLPLVLAQVELPARFRLQLAGIQWIEYYRAPEKKFDELVSVLRGLHQKYGTLQPPDTRTVEFVFRGLDLQKLSQDQRQQLQQQLLEVIASSTTTPRTELNVVTMTSGSVHVFVDMPARTAYQVKTAALNKDRRLIDAGIDALRLSGDREFIPLQVGPQPPPKPGKGGCGRWILGGLALIAAICALVSLIVFGSALLNPDTPLPPDTITFTPTFTPTATFTSTATDTPTTPPTTTSTSTPTSTFTPTGTPLPTDTATPRPTLTVNPPSTFGPAITSSDSFHGGGDACGTPREETIRVIAVDPDEVTAVQIFFRFQNKNTGETTNWNSLPMSYRGGNFPILPMWGITITPADIPGNPAYGNYWFQFYFLATDKTGAQSESDHYEDVITYQVCTFIT